MPTSPVTFLPPRTIASPCVNICRIDARGLCEGCARTLDEISRWTRESDGWRAAVMASLPSRRG